MISFRRLHSEAIFSWRVVKFSFSITRKIKQSKNKDIFYKLGTDKIELGLKSQNSRNSEFYFPFLRLLNSKQNRNTFPS